MTSIFSVAETIKLANIFKVGMKRQFTYFKNACFWSYCEKFIHDLFNQGLHLIYRLCLAVGEKKTSQTKMIIQ